MNHRAWKAVTIATIALMTVHRTQAADNPLWDDIRKHGCVFDGLIWNSRSAGGNVNSSLPDEQDYLRMLRDSDCVFLDRAIETWVAPPDFATIRANMRAAEQAAGRGGFKYGMFIAEDIPCTGTYRDPVSREELDFSKMNVGLYAGGGGGCAPSFEKEEYRKYIRAITRQGMDAGVQVFTFGALDDQDTNWRDSPRGPAIFEQIRADAAAAGKRVAIGGQTRRICPATGLAQSEDSCPYLASLDYLYAPMLLDGARGSFANTMNNSWWDWNNPFVTAQVKVVVDLDWWGPGDDVHTYAKMDQAAREAFIRQATAYLQSAGSGFLLPYASPQPSADRESGECGGPRDVFSPSNSYTCADEAFFTQSQEGPQGTPQRRDQVSQLYTRILGRAPDAGGFAFWVSDERSARDMAAIFASSDEMQSRFPNDADWVTEMYRILLGREPDAGGRQFWIDALAGGQWNRNSVANFFINSAECEGKEGLRPAGGVCLALLDSSADPDPVVMVDQIASAAGPQTQSAESAAEVQPGVDPTVYSVPEPVVDNAAGSN